MPVSSRRCIETLGSTQLSSPGAAATGLGLPRPWGRGFSGHPRGICASAAAGTSAWTPARREGSETRRECEHAFPPGEDMPHFDCFLCGFQPVWAVGKRADRVWRGERKKSQRVRQPNPNQCFLGFLGRFQQREKCGENYFFFFVKIPQAGLLRWDLGVGMEWKGSPSPPPQGPGPWDPLPAIFFFLRQNKQIWLAQS